MNSSKTSLSLNLVLVSVFLGMTCPVYAGPYHFSDILVGDRAMGLGGAFGGVADDSSALYYNPAGLAYAPSSTLSSAVNAFQYTNREYRNLFAGKDSFYEKSSDIIPSFTGGVIDLKKFSDGLHGAFALQNLSQQSTDQNDHIRRPDITVEYLHRAEKSQMSELLFSVGAGKKLNSNLALGATLGGHQMSFDLQQFQDTNLKWNYRTVKNISPLNSAKSIFQSRTLNGRLSIAATALEFGGGLIYSPVPWLSVGLSGHTNFILRQSFTSESDELTTFHYNDLSLPNAADFEALPAATAEAVQNEIDIITNKTLYRKTSNDQKSEITYKYPPAKAERSGSPSFGRSRFRLGLAAFPSPQLLLTFDVAGHHTRTEWIGSSTLTTEYVLNIHQGVEYFFTPRYFVRQGLFTNFDARPTKLSATKNPEHLDFAGSSLFFGIQSSESQFSLGGIYQYGWGQAIKAEGQATPSPVRESKLLMAFTASHGL